MESKKINVLLSSYNGEKYIREQIDSILAQTWENVTLYVRDDGSSDRTAEILREYEEQGRIVFFQGKNVGFIKSFLWLVTHCEAADYYAFADQDDIWLPEKLSMAVEVMDKEQEYENLPLLYFSNYDYYDEQMNYLSHAFSQKEKKHPSFQNALMDCMPLGFNALFNDTARRMVCEKTPGCSCGHDWWMYLVCAGFGKVLYDARPTVKYRRTGHNVSPGGMNFIRHQIWRIRKFIFGSYFKNVRRMLGEYYYFYHDALEEKDRRLLSLFVRKGYNPIVALKKAFYPHMFRQNLTDEILVRIFFLLGSL